MFGGIREAVGVAVVVCVAGIGPAIDCTQAADIDVASVLQLAGSQLLKTNGKLTAADEYPIETDDDGQWKTRSEGHWGAGFYPGQLWFMYEYTGNGSWRALAETSQAAIAGEATRTDTHDLGFMINDSFGQGYRLTGTAGFKDTVMTASTSLASRYNPTVGMIRSWDWMNEWTVIIDNMMNLEMLFWASKNGGDAGWYDMALNHALRTATDHVRSDGSTYHCIDYDDVTGDITRIWSHQGHDTDSTWARGQAWAVNGFATTYRETGDATILETALKTADWYIGHLPDDYVPYWDFDSPDIPHTERDSSAAAIATSGLFTLSQELADAALGQYYWDMAERMLESLTSSSYLSDGVSDDAILLHGTYNHNSGGGVDKALAWGEYYLLEALLKYDQMDSPCIDGDANCDGQVGLLDLDVLGQNWGDMAGLRATGDLNNDGQVGLLDLDVLGATWGDTAVPEPGSVVVMVLGVAGVRRRR